MDLFYYAHFYCIPSPPWRKEPEYERSKQNIPVNFRTLCSKKSLALTEPVSEPRL